MVVPRDGDRWQSTADTRGRIEQLATEASLDVKGIQVAGCVVCREAVVVEFDRRSLYHNWGHFCNEKPPGQVKGVEYREGCWVSRLFFASECYRFPALQDEVDDAVEYHDLEDVLETVFDESSPLNWLAELVPPGFVVPSDAPPVMVAKDSTAEWLALNGVALANRLTPGAFSELEETRTDNKGSSKAIAKAVRTARANGTSDIGINSCDFSGCDHAIFTASLAVAS